MTQASLRKKTIELMGRGLDISEHLGLLRGLACDPDVKSVVEIGFRTGVSAVALLSSGKKLTCIDIRDCFPQSLDLSKATKQFLFIKADSLMVTIPKCDLLHIDSNHTYGHLGVELDRHHKQVSKWIALHDTTTFADEGVDGSTPGLHAAIVEFLDRERMKWKLQLHLTNNNGMTLLQRITS